MTSNAIDQQCIVSPGAAFGLRAVILAGGKGVRLRPFTTNFPKPLVPLGNVPIIELLLRRLIKFGVTDVTLALGHLSELIKAYFHDKHDLVDRIHLSYVVEAEPTGTAGSLAAMPNLDRTFLVMNGDLLTDLDLNALALFHREQNASLTIAAHKRNVKLDFGVLEFDQSLRIRGYAEKPERNYHVSMGIYVYEPSVLRYIEREKYLDFPDLVLKLISAGEKVCAYPSDCMWLDIGRPDDYAAAQEIVGEQRDGFCYV